MDGETGKASWRQGKTGMSRDWDGDPVSERYNNSGLKKQPRHSVHEGKKRKTHGLNDKRGGDE